MKLDFDRNLKNGEDVAVARQVLQTHAGQAHFGGSGPPGKTCRQCDHWLTDGSRKSPNTAEGPILKPSRCRKFAVLTGAPGKEVPYHALACRHYATAPIERPILPGGV